MLQEPPVLIHGIQAPLTNCSPLKPDIIGLQCHPPIKYLTHNSYKYTDMNNKLHPV